MATAFDELLPPEGLLPRQEIEYLETEQIQYEAHIRSLLCGVNEFGVVSPNDMRNIERVMRQKNPEEIVLIDTIEGQRQECNRCRVGIDRLLAQTHELSKIQLAQRIAHFWYRMWRLKDVEFVHHRVRGIRKLRDLAEALKSNQLAFWTAPVPSPVPITNTPFSLMPINSNRALTIPTNAMTTTITTQVGSIPSTLPLLLPTNYPTVSSTHRPSLASNPQHTLANTPAPLTNPMMNRSTAVHDPNDQRPHTSSFATVQTSHQMSILSPQRQSTMNQNYDGRQINNQQPSAPLLEHRQTPEYQPIDWDRQQLRAQVVEQIRAYDEHVSQLRNTLVELDHQPNANVPNGAPVNHGYLPASPIPREQYDQRQQYAYAPEQNQQFNPNYPIVDPNPRAYTPNIQRQPNPMLQQPNQMLPPPPSPIQFQQQPPHMIHQPIARRPDSRSFTQHNSSNRTLDKKLDKLPRWNCCFDGTQVNEKFQTVEDYISAITNFMVSQGVSGQDMVKNLFPTLKGEARKWYTQLDLANITFEQFVSQLRQNYADKRNEADVLRALFAKTYDGKCSVIAHIDSLIFDMSSVEYGWSNVLKVEIITSTFPERIREQIIMKDVRTLEELKGFCQKMYPPSMKTKKKLEKPNESRRKVMSIAQVDTESETSEEESEDDPDVIQICELMKKKFPSKFSPKTKKDRGHRKLESKPRYDKEPEIKTISNSNSSANAESAFDKTKIEGEVGTICFQCRAYGHMHQNCKQPRTFKFCYKCGRPNSTTDDCVTDSCVKYRRESKNE